MGRTHYPNCICKVILNMRAEMGGGGSEVPLATRFYSWFSPGV